MPFAAGLAWGAWLDRDLPGLGWALLLMTVLVIFLAKRKAVRQQRWAFGLAVHVLLFTAGYTRVVWQNESRQPGHFSFRVKDIRVLAGTVYDAPSRGSHLKIPLRLEAAGGSPDSLWPCTGQVLLFVEIDSAAAEVHYGDLLVVRASVLPTELPKNPYAFDYRRYLHFQNIHYQSFVKADSFRVLSSGHGYAVWRAAFACRDRLLELLRRHFPDTEEYAVASALLVGYKDDLSDDLRTAYAETGSMHALAVSGTHVGLLYAGLMFLLKRIRWRGRLRQWLQTAFILAAIWAFTFLTGATASVLRASVMFSTFLLGKSLHQDASIWNILASSAFGLLVFNPYFLFDAGFQLSYAAVAGMVFFYPRLNKIAPAKLPVWAGEAWKIFLIGVAAQIGTLPLSLYYFHQFPCYFWLAGWVVVLGGAIFLWGGAALVLLDWLSPPLAAWLGVALHGLLWGMNRLIFLIKDLPGSVLTGVWLPAWAAVVLYGVIGMSGMALLTRKLNWITGALGLLFVLGAARAGRAVQQLNQGQIIVYQVNKQHLVDFFEGPKAWVRADSVSQRQVLFAARANRWAAGIREETELPEQDFCSKNLYYRPPFAQFFDQKLVFLDDAHWVDQTDEPLAVDVLVISHNPRLSMADCLRRFPGRLVVLDASNSRKNASRWTSECRELGVACHDVREQGAWVWIK